MQLNRRSENPDIEEGPASVQIQ